MPSPRFEVPVGAIDGSNTVFAVSKAYSAGSTAVFLNGILQERSYEDGWVETDPNAGVVTLKEAPRLADTVQIFYLDTVSTVLPETQIFKMRGILKAARSIRATFRPAQTIQGRISTPTPLVGRIGVRKDLRGTVSVTRTIKAKIKVCV